jgi:hypothetical protein
MSTNQQFHSSRRLIVRGVCNALALLTISSVPVAQALTISAFDGIQSGQVVFHDDFNRLDGGIANDSLGMSSALAPGGGALIPRDWAEDGTFGPGGVGATNNAAIDTGELRVFGQPGGNGWAAMDLGLSDFRLETQIRFDLDGPIGGTGAPGRAAHLSFRNNSISNRQGPGTGDLNISADGKFFLRDASSGFAQLISGNLINDLAGLDSDGDGLLERGERFDIQLDVFGQNAALRAKNSGDSIWTLLGATNSLTNSTNGFLAIGENNLGGQDYDILYDSVAAASTVPEPSSHALMVLAGLLAWRQSKRTKRKVSTRS